MQTILKILPGSPLSGKTYADVAGEYRVKIIHYYNPSLGAENARNPKGDDQIIPPVYLELAGEFDSVRRLSLDSVKFAQTI